MSAVSRFNQWFGFHFSEPVRDQYLDRMADYARLRGREDLALDLEASKVGLPAASPTPTPPEHRFPGGRW